jgi:hypothetical protein
MLCVCVCVFFFGGGGACQGVIYHEFLPRGQTVKIGILSDCDKKAWERQQGEKRSDLWRGKNDFSIMTRLRLIPPFWFVIFFTKHETTLIPQPPYSPDLAPPDFFLFTKLKSVRKGWRFEPDEEIKQNSLAELRGIPKEAFQECFQNWEKRWERWTKSGGAYFEGTNLIARK